MLILTRHEIESLLTINDAIAAVESGFAQLSAGEVVMPQRVPTQVAPYSGMHLSMPVFVASDPGTLSIKAITVYPENPAQYGLPMVQGVVLLYDAVNGKLLALMDAEEITAMRTGAASGVATKHLARADASTVLLFGAGALGPAQLAAVCAVRPIQQAYVITKSGDKDAEFCTQMSNRLGIPVTPVRAQNGHPPQSAIRNSAIICTATTSYTPLFDGAWLQPGTHINGVGSYNAKMREVDTTTVRRARVFVDRIQAAQNEAGDLLIPITNGEITLDHIAGELGQAINGTIPGRTNGEEITFFKSVGTAMQDAVTAAVVYRKALAQGVGQEIGL